jgi:hypothetical protein
MLRKLLFVLIAAAALGTAALLPSPASAWHGRGHGGWGHSGWGTQLGIQRAPRPGTPRLATPQVVTGDNNRQESDTRRETASAKETNHPVQPLPANTALTSGKCLRSRSFLIQWINDLHHKATRHALSRVADSKRAGPSDRVVCMHAPTLAKHK